MCQCGAVKTKHHMFLECLSTYTLHQLPLSSIHKILIDEDVILCSVFESLGFQGPNYYYSDIRIYPGAHLCSCWRRHVGFCLNTLFKWALSTLVVYVFSRLCMHMYYCCCFSLSSILCVKCILHVFYCFSLSSTLVEKVNGKQRHLF